MNNVRHSSGAETPIENWEPAVGDSLFTTEARNPPKEPRTPSGPPAFDIVVNLSA